MVMANYPYMTGCSGTGTKKGAVNNVSMKPKRLNTCEPQWKWVKSSYDVEEGEEQVAETELPPHHIKAFVSQTVQRS